MSLSDRVTTISGGEVDVGEAKGKGLFFVVFR